MRADRSLLSLFIAYILKGDELIKRIRKNIKDLTMELYVSILQMEENKGSFDFAGDKEIQLQLDVITKALSK